MLKNSPRLALALLLTLFAAPLFSQQMGTGTIDGRIVDATGAVLPGVSVTIANAETGLSRTVVTDENGRFRVPLLPVGRYVLTTDLAGFQSLRRDGLVLNVGQQQSLGDLTIEVATVEETVTVTAESPLIEVARAVPAATFDSREIENLPIAGRDYKNFALNTPNVVMAGPASGRTTINMGGMKGIDTNITVDGADFNNTFFGSATGQPEVPYFVVSQEAVQEFQVLANGYSAEFGRSGGGFLNVVTKSGTNDLRGSAFFFGRNEALRSTLQDGNGNDLTNAQFSQQQFGGSFGGPIIKDKAHFFFAIDRQGFDRPVAIRFNRNVAGVCNTAIYGQLIGGVDCLSDEEGDTAELLDNTAILGKVDIQLNSTNTLSVRYNFSDFTGENFFSTAGGVAGTVQAAAENGTNLEANTSHSIVVSNTSLIGTDKFNEIRFQYSFEQRPRLGQSEDLPTIVINDTGRFGKQWFLPITSDHSRIQITDNFTYLFGDHDLKMGADINLTDTSQAFYGWGGGYYGFNTLEDYVGGRPAQFTQRLGLNGFTTPESGTIDIGQEEVALYFNDTWRPKPGLTLNLGVRWEGQWNPTAPEQTDGKQSRNPANPGLDTIGLVQGDIPDDLNNLAPRVGFAWDPGNDGRTVVRGGAGVFYSRSNLLLMANSFTANGYRQALFFLFGSQIPTFPFVFPESGLPPDDPLNSQLPVSDIAFFDDNFQNARTTRANIGIEHEIMQDFSIGADYVFADTVNDHRRTNRNIPQPPIGFDALRTRALRRNPNRSRVQPISGGGIHGRAAVQRDDALFAKASLEPSPVPGVLHPLQLEDRRRQRARLERVPQYSAREPGRGLGGQRERFAAPAGGERGHRSPVELRVLGAGRDQQRKTLQRPLRRRQQRRSEHERLRGRQRFEPRPGGRRGTGAGRRPPAPELGSAAERVPDGHPLQQDLRFRRPRQSRAPLRDVQRLQQRQPAHQQPEHRLAQLRLPQHRWRAPAGAARREVPLVA